MQVFKEKEQLRATLANIKSANKTIGLVPTMGALHDGHLYLVNEAFKSCDQVVVSIFVNPTQFDNPSDLEKYPRDLDKDIDLIRKISENIIVFTPNANELYGDKVISQHFDFDGLDSVMEGKHRNGHFDGVGTVVKLLFETAEPDKAFFGEKDYQQLQIIKKLTEIERIPVEIIGCPILREESGLARSSRNERLNDLQREKAAFIYATLKETQTLFGTESANYINDWVEQQFKNYPFLELEYFEISDAETLKEITEKREGISYRAFIAAYAGDIRLIDNLALNN
ncbi:pantoate--beta-alanine ligase [Zunongwangia sp. HGR-M22]|uniref:pantoate--beta-alanine ligase n=1 Tax=Zunongwangia sp. HGR-M22 TaxID=3015168 RepID=UPI0022DD7001|nr:pantoate--beta-alanine ligase [Zunongwangia sp. HGR-M22]WBL25430.1 pantoate--beta-alanine ligase [Zunongwangia sp. HGR-M22]